MAQGFTPGLQVTRAARIKKVRELQVPGELLKKVGDDVRADEIIARASLPGDLYIARVAEKMGIEPFEVKRGLKVSIGSEVHEGALLCEHLGLFGLFRTRFTSPVPGTVEIITEATGHIGIRLAPKPITLDAYLTGRVVASEPNKSITIEAQAALVQGIFGIGGEQHGTLQLLAVNPETALTEAHIPDQCQGKILVGGLRPSLEALRTAAMRGATGMVTGSIDDRALAGYLGYDLGIALTGDEEVSMSVIVTEGFGSIPMAARSLALLKEFDGQLCSINGATQVRAGALRPEVIVVHSAHESVVKEVTSAGELAVGKKVRLIRVPYFGKLATITALPHELKVIETGAEARVLSARLEDGREVLVPRANVELV